MCPRTSGSAVVHTRACSHVRTYSAGEEKSPLFIFLHDELPFFLAETGRNSENFLQVSPGNPIFSPGNTCISP